jgi:transposase InsO family protein
MQEEIQHELLLMKVDAIREVHPKMGIRKIYKILAPEEIGRDKFEMLLLNNGYRVNYPRNYIRTTYSVKCYQYTNLIKGIELTGTNQVWQSDITYFLVGSKFYYLVFIIDVYSRRIIGYKASNTLETKANIEALQMAFDLRGQQSYPKLIHHSDRGSQYASHAYTSLLRYNQCSISMCDFAFENAYAERVNGIIKNEYLKSWHFNNLEELKGGLKRAVYAYNYGRPHDNLYNKFPPVSFENYALPLSAEKRPKVKLYTEGQKQEVKNE